MYYCGQKVDTAGNNYQELSYIRVLYIYVFFIYTCSLYIRVLYSVCSV